MNCIIMHHFSENCKDVAKQLRAGSAHIWTFRGEFIDISAWTCVGAVALERVADVETPIFATKIGRPALPYRIVQGLEGLETGSSFFLWSVVGTGPGGEPFKEGCCTLNTDH